MRPLRIRYAGSVFQDLIEMTDAEIKTIFTYALLTDYATGSTTGTATLNINGGSGTSIGTFTDSWRTEAVGFYDAVGTTSSTTYTFKQITSAATDTKTNRAVGLSGTDIREFTDTQYNTDLLDLMIADMVAGNQIGQYQLKTSTPSGGTWTSRGTLTNTTDSGGGGTTTTWTLYQKTALASPPSSTANRPLKFNTDGLKEMTDAEIQQASGALRNRIINNLIGTYKLQSATPTPGTWVQMGDVLTDTIQDIGSVLQGDGYFHNTVLATATTTGSGGSVKLWVRTA